MAGPEHNPSVVSTGTSSLPGPHTSQPPATLFLTGQQHARQGRRQCPPPRRALPTLSVLSTGPCPAGVGLAQGAHAHLCLLRERGTHRPPHGTRPPRKRTSGPHCSWVVATGSSSAPTEINIAQRLVAHIHTLPCAPGCLTRSVAHTHTAPCPGHPTMVSGTCQLPTAEPCKSRILLLCMWECSGFLSSAQPEKCGAREGCSCGPEPADTGSAQATLHSPAQSLAGPSVPRNKGQRVCW